MGNDLQNLKKILGSYEDQNSKIVELEGKLKNQKMNYSKKIKEMENNYDYEISELYKKIYMYENPELSSNFKKKNYKNFNSVQQNKNKEYENYQMVKILFLSLE